MTNKAHLEESHDQCRMLLESSDEYRTLFESHYKQSYRTSLRVYLDDTFRGFRRWIWLGWRREAALRLPRFDGYFSVSDNLFPFG